LKFIIKIDRPYAANELILMQGIFVSKVRNERRWMKSILIWSITLFNSSPFLFRLISFTGY